MICTDIAAVLAFLAVALTLYAKRGMHLARMEWRLIADERERMVDEMDGFNKHARLLMIEVAKLRNDALSQAAPWKGPTP